MSSAPSLDWKEIVAHRPDGGKWNDPMEAWVEWVPRAEAEAMVAEVLEFSDRYGAQSALLLMALEGLFPLLSGCQEEHSDCVRCNAIGAARAALAAAKEEK